MFETYIVSLDVFEVMRLRNMLGDGGLATTSRSIDYKDMTIRP